MCALVLRDLGNTVRTPLAMPVGAAFTVGVSLWCTDTFAALDWSESRTFCLAMVLGIAALWSTMTVTINAVVQERTHGCYATLQTAGVAPIAILASKAVAASAMTFCLAWLGGIALSLAPATSSLVAAWMAAGSVPFVLLGIASGIVAKTCAASSAPVLALSLLAQVVAISYAWSRLASVARVSPLALGQMGAVNLTQGLWPSQGIEETAISWLLWLVIGVAGLLWATRRLGADAELPQEA